MNYTRNQTSVNATLKSKGQVVTLTKKSTGSYSTSAGSATVTTSTQSAYAVVFDYGTKQIDGTLIKAGDKNLLLSPLKTDGTALTAPELNDTVIVGGITYTLVEPLKTLNPGGTVILYDCNMRV